MPRTKVKFLQIILKYPAEVSVRDAFDYSKSALEHWGGQFHPDDPLFPSPRLRMTHARGLKLIKGETKCRKSSR